MNDSSPSADSSWATRWNPPRRDVGFYIAAGCIGLFYFALIVAMLAADLGFALTHRQNALATIFTEEIRYATWLSLISSSISTIISLWIAIPTAYLMSRTRFFGRSLIDAVMDVPIFLPPLVIGLSLLILFRQTPLVKIDNWLGIVFHVPAVIIAQVTVATAFAIRTLRGTFESISPRGEQVARTLGCSRSQAFLWVVLPEAKRGILTAGTIAWARSLGEFGPILVFAGSTRKRTEVLPVSVHLELSIGNIEGAVGVSLMMVFLAILVLIIVRLSGNETSRN